MDGKKILCSLTDIEKRYTASVPVLGPLSLAVYEGEILGIRGSNGAGKSTLLGVMAGVLRADAGNCRYEAETGGRIGYAPQELCLYGSLTGLQNLRFWGLSAGLSGKTLSVRSSWLLQQLELKDKGKKVVSTYSGGMKRRLQLATALMGMPRLLLLDEPTVGADTHSIDLILTMLMNLKRQGCGMVLISHQSGELGQVCDRILTLEQGIVTAEESLA